MVNFGGNPAFILGIAMILCGVALYAMRSVRPELSRDHDIFFAAIALISGLILMFQGWRLDPLLFMGQFALAGSAVFFGVENIRLRKISTEQAKRNTSVVDEERPVSRNYDYDDSSDFEELPYSQARPARRIRATRDDRDYDDYETGRRRRPATSRRRSLEPRDDYAPSASSRKPLPRARQRPDGQQVSARRSDWEEDQWSNNRPSRSDQWGEDATPTSRAPRPSIQPQIVEPAIEPVVASDDAMSAPAGSTYRSGGREPKSLSRYRSRRRSADMYAGGGAAASGGGDYADYQPVDYGDDASSGGDDYGDRYR
ncbi:MAG: Ycf66 family protein [Elainellaceae cyanobacterium]